MCNMFNTAHLCEKNRNNDYLAYLSHLFLVKTKEKTSGTIWFQTEIVSGFFYCYIVTPANIQGFKLAIHLPHNADGFHMYKKKQKKTPKKQQYDAGD